MIAKWIAEGKEKGKAFLIIADDTFSHETPVYCNTWKETQGTVKRLYWLENMSRVRGVYDLSTDTEVEWKTLWERA